MSGTEIRAKLLEFINASEEEKSSVVRKYESDLLSDLAEAEMKLLIDEVKDKKDQELLLENYIILGLFLAQKKLDENPAEKEFLLNLLLDWIESETGEASEAYLETHKEELLTDKAQLILSGLIETSSPNEDLKQLYTILIACREKGIKNTFQDIRSGDFIALANEKSDDNGLGSLIEDLLVNWDDEEKMTVLLDHLSIEMHDPFEKDIEAEIAKSKDPLIIEVLNQRLELVRKVRAKLNPDEMLGFEDAMLFDRLFYVMNQNQMIELIESESEETLNRIQSISEHQLQVATRESKLSMLRERLHDFKRLRYERKNPLVKLIRDFLYAESDEDAKAILLADHRLLLTMDAKRELDRHTSDNSDTLELLHRRAELWKQTRFEQDTKSRVKVSFEGMDVQSLEISQTKSVEGIAAHFSDQQTKYLVVHAQNCAIGDNALTINNVGRIPLEWKHPQEFQRGLTEKAVGRQRELEELHKSLQAASATAIVAKGTSSAVHGLPGVGKSTLAAMYAEQYSINYPGGVIWIKLGPNYLTAESVLPLITKVATYAYGGDVQAYDMFGDTQSSKRPLDVEQVLKTAQFTPEIVQMLLTGHGAILVIVDDIWEKSTLNPIRDMLPVDSYLLITTRDLRVALGVKNKVELDVLSELLTTAEESKV